MSLILPTDPALLRRILAANKRELRRYMSLALEHIHGLNCCLQTIERLEHILAEEPEPGETVDLSLQA